MAASCPKSQVNTSRSVVEDQSYRGIQAIAVDCEMVAGDIDDICARVCLVDEAENLIFHTYIKPQNPVTNYRYFESPMLSFGFLKIRKKENFEGSYIDHLHIA